jgi:hypothetical protein
MQEQVEKGVVSHILPVQKGLKRVDGSLMVMILSAHIFSKTKGWMGKYLKKSCSY